MRHWFGGIATTCRTATAYEESPDIAQAARFSQQPPALPLCLPRVSRVFCCLCAIKSTKRKDRSRRRTGQVNQRGRKRKHPPALSTNDGVTRSLVLGTILPYEGHEGCEGCD